MKKRICSILLLVLALSLLAACGTAPEAAAPEAASDFNIMSASPSAAAPMPTPAADAPMVEVAEEAADFAFDEAERFALDGDVVFRAATVESDYFSLPILTPSDAADRRLIYTVHLSLQTTEFLPGMRLLLDTVAEADGYLVSATVHGSDLRRPSEKYGEFRFRVPTEQLGEFIRVVENNYNIWSLHQNMQEQTARYRQTDWTLNDLRERADQLEEILETATGNARAAAEEELREIQRSIRELEAAQAEIISDVIYSTVDVQLFEVIFPEGDDNNLATIIAWAVIGVFVLAAVIAVWVVVRRNARAAKAA